MNWVPGVARRRQGTSVDAAHELRLQLAREFSALVRGWTLGEVCARLVVPVSVVSELRRGRVKHVGTDRLVRMIAALGYDVEVTLVRMRPPVRIMARATARVVRDEEAG